MSDGSATIVFRDPGTFAIKRTIRTGQLTQINELEYVRGEIWANIWHSDKIARIRSLVQNPIPRQHLRGLQPSFFPPAKRPESTIPMLADEPQLISDCLGRA
jgi:hypothetical protein